MSNLIINAPAAAPADETLRVGDYPPLSTNQFRIQMRLDGTANPDRVRSALSNAATRVRADLESWCSHKLIGMGSESTHPAGSIGFEAVTRLTSHTLGGDATAELYRTAVYHYAAAALCEQMASYDTAPTASNKAREDTAADQSSSLRALGWEALRRIMGKPNAECELL